jgi:hypothetical protein
MSTPYFDGPADHKRHVAARLEYLRGEINNERISMSEVAELQGLAEHIDPSDVQLLEWAGVPEHPEADVETTFTVEIDAGKGYEIVHEGTDKDEAASKWRQCFEEGYNARLWGERKPL